MHRNLTLIHNTSDNPCNGKDLQHHTSQNPACHMLAAWQLLHTSLLFLCVPKSAVTTPSRQTHCCVILSQQQSSAHFCLHHKQHCRDTLQQAE
jgi:hypothetical protein